MNPIAFISAASILFGLLSLIWERDTWLNLGLKFTFFGFAIWGVITILRMGALS